MYSELKRGELAASAIGNSDSQNQAFGYGYIFVP
jgi:hypothetical protein